MKNKYRKHHHIILNIHFKGGGGGGWCLVWVYEEINIQIANSRRSIMNIYGHSTILN